MTHDRESYLAGLRQAEEIAVRLTDELWDEEFRRHGNPGLCKMKQKVGFRIEEAIHAEWKKLSA